MDLDGEANPQDQPNTRQEGHHSHLAMLHQWIFLPVMGILGWLLQLKFTSTTASPFVTHNITMLIFVASFFVYFGFLTLKIQVPAPSSALKEFINNMIFLFGTLATILLLLILVRAFGFLALVIWAIYVVKDVATKKSYKILVCHVFSRVKEMINDGHLVMVETNALEPQPPSHIVLIIQDPEEPDVL